MTLKSKIVELVKHNSWIYHFYNYLGSKVLSVCSFFIKTDDKLIMFNSFGGKKYDDSPKKIYEFMMKDPRFDDYKLVWAFHEPSMFPEVLNKIKSDNIKYFKTILKARCWVTNSSFQRGLVFKGRNTLNFNTWHGSPIKKMGVDQDPKLNVEVMQMCDCILAQSEFEKRIMSSAYHVSPEKYRVFGLPRNDELAQVTEEEVQMIRKKLKIPTKKKVVLYAPTFREYLLNKDNMCQLDIPIDFDYWDKMLGAEYVFILRAHYEVAAHTKLPESGTWIDFSSYPRLNDLLKIADILITDYSSICFDYSIMEKPIFCYTYDYDDYERKRGMYFDIRKELTSSENGNEIADMILNIDWAKEKEKARVFHNNYVESYGEATKQSVDYIWNSLKKVKRYGD